MLSEQRFVGKATIEIDAIDSVTNQLGGADLDKRAVGKHYEGSTDTWAHVKQAVDLLGRNPMPS